MSIKVGQAFERTSAQPIDTSLTLTKAGMLAVNDNLMPAYYFTICQDDGAIYLYSKTATPTVTTGKFKKFEGGSGGADIHSTTATLNDEINGTKTVLATDLPGVTISDLTIGSSIIKDDKGTLGLVTAINDPTDITVTTATTSTPVKELTQAEYDALSQAEKDNGTIYFITDGKFPGTVLSAHETIYTETERVIGSYMGKPLYQKTISTSWSNMTSDASYQRHLDLSDPIDTPISVSAIMYMNGKALVENGTTISDNSLSYSTGINLNMITGTPQIYWTVGNGITDRPGNLIVTIRYTKTTDTASPVGYATPNDYSTSEKIVGTWVDGKPIYQKTIIGTATLPAMPSYLSIGTTSELISSDIGDIIDVLITGKGTGAAYQGYQSPASYVAYVNIGGNINVGQGIASGTTEIAYRITVKYTKTD